MKQRPWMSKVIQRMIEEDDKITGKDILISWALAAAIIISAMMVMAGIIMFGMLIQYWFEVHWKIGYIAAGGVNLFSCVALLFAVYGLLHYVARKYLDIHPN